MTRVLIDGRIDGHDGIGRYTTCLIRALRSQAGPTVTINVLPPTGTPRYSRAEGTARASAVVTPTHAVARQLTAAVATCVWRPMHFSAASPRATGPMTSGGTRTAAPTGRCCTGSTTSRSKGAAGCADLFRGAVLHDLASALIGPVRATVCAMVVKTPGVAGVPWHRARIDVAPGAAINLSVFLDRATVENGCFEAVPGSHLLADDADVLRTRDLGPRMAVPRSQATSSSTTCAWSTGRATTPCGELRRSIIIEFASQAG